MTAQKPVQIYHKTGNEWFSIGVAYHKTGNEWFSIGVAFLAFFSPGNISKLGLIFKYQRLF